MKKIVDTKKINKKDKGFTLIELLATIAILALVVGIVVYVAITIVNNAREKSYEVTINEIENEANNYVLEDVSSGLWVDSDDGKSQYQCITVQNLIDTGYFKGDVLESYVAKDVNVKADDYIYLERDKESNTITKSILLVNDVDEIYFELCGGIEAGGEISFLVEPTQWSREKNVTIKYNIYNNIDKVSNYKYNYSFGDISLEGKFDSLSIKENITVVSNGTLYATINGKDGFNVSSSTKITKIDRTGPVISSNYNGSEVVNHSVTIPIILEDSQSGVDNNSFTLSDLVVTIGDKVITSGLTLNKVGNNNYALTIVNDVYVGEVKITIDKGMVVDLVVDEEKNGNEKTILNPGVIFNNVHLIKYNSNGGTGTMKNTACSYRSECTLRKNSFTNAGYTFKGWSNSSSSTDILYEDEDTITYNSTSDTELYAVWGKNKINIRYNVNGGTITATNNNGAYNWKHDSSGLIYLNNNVLTYSINYGSSLGADGLANWDNANYIKITKTGYSAVTGAEWKCLSGCTTSGKTFADNQVYSANDFCDASNGDCTVVLGVNWVINKYTLTYDANGGSGAPAAETISYGSSATVSSTAPTKTSWDKNAKQELYCAFLGWNTKADGTGTSYESEDTLTLTSNVTLYAQWHCHTWGARGVQIYEPNWTNAEPFDCNYKHCKAFLIYCSVCGMSKQYYKWYVYDENERSKVTYTMNCPCDHGGFSVIYDDSKLTLDQAKKFGGIYYGEKKKLSTIIPDSEDDISEQDCSEHYDTVDFCNLE